jgi:UDP-N-acetylglucosamine 2-epimerase
VKKYPETDQYILATHHREEKGQKVKNTQEMIRTFWQLITIKREDCEKYPRTDQNILATYHWQEKGQKSEKYTQN